MFRNGHENDSRDSFQRGSSLGKSGKVEKQKGRKKKILLFLFFLCIAREPVFQAERVPSVLTERLYGKEEKRMKKNTIQKMTLLAMLVALGVVISPILRVEGMCPMAHFINIVCSVLLGPWYSLLCAVLIGILRMSFMGIPPLALTGAVFGAFLSGVFYRISKGRMIYAVLGEVIGTGLIGAVVSYPVMAGLMGRTGLTWLFYVPSFICGTLIGGSVAFLFLKYLNQAKLLAKIQNSLGSPVTEQPENSAADSIGIAVIGILVFVAVYVIMTQFLEMTGEVTIGVPAAAFLLVELVAFVYFQSARGKKREGKA